MFGNPERGITAGETSGALDQDKRVQGVRVQSMLLQERSANLRLEGRKREIAMGITRYNELLRRRTEMTDAIKENNGVVGLHASAPPSSHTHALSGICETSYVSPSKPSHLSTARSFTKICRMPTPGLCRAGCVVPGMRGPSGAAVRHNQSASRKASSVSSGR